MINLSLETLPQYDGGSLAILVNRALTQLRDDLDDRPAVKKARKVTITIEAKPRDVDGNNLETVEMSIAVKLAIPNKETRTHILANRSKERALGFETDTARARHLPGQMKLVDDELDI